MLWRRLSCTVLLASCAAALSACATFQPVPPEALQYQDRALSASRDGISVKVAVLSRDEARQLFGVNLYEGGVQPIWLEITNATAQPFWLMIHGLDPNYFSAHEVAYMNHFRFAGSTNREMDAYFSSLGIEQRIPPGETRSGFAFANEVPGTRRVRIRLFGDKDIREFELFPTVPGQKSDWTAKDLPDYSGRVTDAGTPEELRTAILSQVACCLSYGLTVTDGLPVNIVLIGQEAALRALLTAGWEESKFRDTMASSLLDGRLYNRPPDLSFEKSRQRRRSAIRLQLWAIPVSYQGRKLFAGVARRDNDPNIDEAAVYVMEDLALNGTVQRFGYLPVVEPSDRDTPVTRFAQEPYWTSGNRLVLDLSADALSLDNIEAFPWSWRGRVIFAPERASPEALP